MRLWLASVCFFALAGLSAYSAPDRPGELRQIGRIDHRPMRETSGLVQSRTYPGVYWAICDSGNHAHLYAVDRAGKLVAEYRVRGATNVDWEAITIDDSGNLFIADVGNNSTRVLPKGLSTRRVYRVKEPDPRSVSRSPSGKHSLPEVPLDKTYYYTFPGMPFDCEAVFVRRGEFYLISKMKKGETTKLYRLPLDRPGESTKLIEVCSLPKLKTVTDACLSPDGRRLAVCSYSYAAVFELQPCDAIESLGTRRPTVVRFPTETSIEACAWNGDELILASESREVYTLRFP